MTRPRVALVALLLVAAFASTPACEGTSGRRAVFDLAVQPAHAPERFRTALGWEVTLAEACVSVGPVYFYAEPGLSASLRDAYDWLVPSAHAHPGVDHFNGGEVRGEWLDQVAVDLTSSHRVDIGAREGIAGEARSVTIGIHPAEPSTLGAVHCLRGHQAHVAGTASRGDAVVRFEGGLDIEAVGSKRRIRVGAAVTIDDGRQLVLVIDPRPWLDNVKFDELAVDPGTGQAVIAPGGQAALAWELGLHTAGAFEIQDVR